MIGASPASEKWLLSQTGRRAIISDGANRIRKAAHRKLGAAGDRLRKVAQAADPFWSGAWNGDDIARHATTDHDVEVVFARAGPCFWNPAIGGAILT